MFTVSGIVHHMRLNALQKMEDAAMERLWLAYYLGVRPTRGLG
jgi:hypothetical protein